MSEVWEEWYRSLTEREQDALVESIGVLREYGPSLTRPHADTLKGSKFPNMRELRTQVGGQPYRSLYAFDPKRQAILLCGGDKTGDGRFTRG